LKTASFAQGDYVIREGEMGDVFYILEEGEAEATKTFEPGKPAQVVKRYSPGDYFGELALIKGEPRAANVIARVRLYFIFRLI
jgi:cAMP-dependent protein kinase regulator